MICWRCWTYHLHSSLGHPSAQPCDRGQVPGGFFLLSWKLEAAAWTDYNNVCENASKKYGALHRSSLHWVIVPAVAAGFRWQEEAFRFSRFPSFQTQKAMERTFPHPSVWILHREVRRPVQCPVREVQGVDIGSGWPWQEEVHRMSHWCLGSC